MDNNKKFLLPSNEDTVTTKYCYDTKNIVYYKTADKKLIQFSSIYSIIDSIFSENRDKINTILTKISENKNSENSDLYNITEDTILNDSDYTTGG